LHQSEAMNGLADQFGEAAAVLLGDLALVWSDHLLHTSGVSDAALLSALSVHDEMRIELMAGQYLDVREAGEKTPSVDRSLRIARYKSGKYTIERPLHLGASLAIIDRKERSQLVNVLSAYGLPLGEAFQLRDDVLGIFGNPDETGKPAGDDLREGKRTVLLAKTMELADEESKTVIKSALGNPNLALEHVNKIREIITDCGALAEVEKLISSMTSSAQSALEHGEIDPVGKVALTQLLTIVTQRTL